MASQNLTDYERRRLENIRRNEKMMAAFKIHSKASDLADAVKRQRVASKSYKAGPAKKPKTLPTPIVIRRSLRTRGMPPDTKGLDDDVVESITQVVQKVNPEKPSPRNVGPLSMRDAYSGEGSDRVLVDAILGFAKESELGFSIKDEIRGRKAINQEEMSGLGDFVKVECESEPLDFPLQVEKRELESCLDLESLVLKSENVARVMPGRIMVVKFFPCNNVRMVATGNKFGNVAFWNVDSKEDEDAIFLYRPHTGPISGIVVQQSCFSKIFSSCYDGFIRLMDAEKEIFDLVYTTDNTIFSLSQQPNDVKSLYFGEGQGGLSIWDERAGKVSTEMLLHEARINSIDFNCQNPNIMATSSTDGTACLWDLRSMNMHKPKSLKNMRHKRAVHSAYFSPSGGSLATTSYDNTVGILTGVNFEDTYKIHHDNHTGRWISTFRAIWGWDDSYVFIGNMKRGVDVISPALRKSIMTLQSPNMSAIPCRFDVHPHKVGMLAGATSGGQVYIWTSG